MKTINEMTPEEVMAFVKQPGFEVILMGLSGRLGKMLVFKQYKGRTLITKYPDRSKVVLTEKQMKHRARFRAAHLWAKRHAEEFRKIAEKKDMSPYRYGVREFFRRGLREEDLEREVAGNQHQTREKKAPRMLMGLWMAVAHKEVAPIRMGGKDSQGADIRAASRLVKRGNGAGSGGKTRDNWSGKSCIVPWKSDKIE